MYAPGKCSASPHSFHVPSGPFFDDDVTSGTCRHCQQKIFRNFKDEWYINSQTGEDEKGYWTTWIAERYVIEEMP